MKAVSTYFATGALPKPGTICRIEQDAFGNPLPPTSDTSADSKADDQTLDAKTMRALQTAHTDVAAALAEVMAEHWTFGLVKSTAPGGLASIMNINV